MEYTIEAKPVVYEGRVYRSKLEATWAIYFGLLGLCYEYEPGNLYGWLPDFAILANGTKYFVEIKPTTELDADTIAKLQRCVSNTKDPLNVCYFGLFPVYNSFGWQFKQGEWQLINSIGGIMHNISKWNQAKNEMQYLPVQMPNNNQIVKTSDNLPSVNYYKATHKYKRVFPVYYRK